MLPAHSQVRVHSSNGDLTVQTGTGPQIVVHGQLSGSFVRPSSSHRPRPRTEPEPQPRVPRAHGNCLLGSLASPAPAGLPVSVSDSFGELRRQRAWTATVTLSDNTGDLTASRLTGNVHLSDGFGALTASGLAGSIRLDNNSGDIQAAGVVGNTRIQDSFGSNVSVAG